MLISIIIPTYNVAAFIQDTLKSIVNQTHSDLEVILVDDASTDESTSCIKDFIATQCQGISMQLIELKKNAGPSRARNTGMKAAKGEYIFFLDSDDFIDPNCLHYLAKAQAEHPCDFVLADYACFPDASLRARRPSINLPEHQLITQPHITLARIKNRIPVEPWNKLFNRNFLLENKLFFREDILFEDILWDFHVSQKASQIAFTGQTTYYYRQHLSSISHSHKFDDRYMKSHMLLCEEILQEAIAQGGTPLLVYASSLCISLLKKAKRYKSPLRQEILQLLTPPLRSIIPNLVKSMKWNQAYRIWQHTSTK